MDHYELRNQFWHFVHNRALDMRSTAPQRDSSPVLDWYELGHAKMSASTDPFNRTKEALVLALGDLSQPIGYMRVENALDAFRIHLATHRVNVSFALWVQAVALVLVQGAFDSPELDLFKFDCQWFDRNIGVQRRFVYTMQVGTRWVDTCTSRPWVKGLVNLPNVYARPE